MKQHNVSFGIPPPQNVSGGEKKKKKKKCTCVRKVWLVLEVRVEHHGCLKEEK